MNVADMQADLAASAAANAPAKAKRKPPALRSRTKRGATLDGRRTVAQIRADHRNGVLDAEDELLPARGAGRPAGSFGACHLAAVAALRDAGPMTLRELIAAAGLTLQTAKDALRAAIDSGEVQVCGQQKHANGRRWVRIYEWVDNTEALFKPNATPPAAEWAADLHQVFSAWGGSV